MNQQIIMNFSVPPSTEDLAVIANNQLQNMPDELIEYIEGLTVQIEEVVDETTESDLELDDPYELLMLYKAGGELAPGVEKKVTKEGDVLVIYRRPILDLWCERGEDLTSIMREAMVEEIATQFEFPEENIDEMNARHHQGML